MPSTTRAAEKRARESGIIPDTTEPSAPSTDGPDIEVRAPFSPLTPEEARREPDIRINVAGVEAHAHAPR